MKTEECKILNSATDGEMPSRYTASHHVHILVKSGAMTFSDGRKKHEARKDDLVIWQMSNSIGEVAYSDGFEAEYLIVSPQFLVQYNPEMVWAAKGFIFIRTCPVFRLEGESLRLIENDLRLFRSRERVQTPFQSEVAGRLLQIFLFDLWSVYRDGLTSQATTDNTSRLFLRYLSLVQENVCTQREVAYYADRLCITPKYLSQVCRTASGISAMQWIVYYASFEIVTRLDDNERPLSDIADELGFSSLQFFSRYVRKCLGISPSEYRRSKGF